MSDFYDDFWRILKPVGFSNDDVSLLDAIRQLVAQHSQMRERIVQLESLLLDSQKHELAANLLVMATREELARLKRR